MPMIPELTVAVLACARIGAIHSVIFAGFSASAVADRVNDAQAVAIITSDGSYRGTKSIGVKSLIDEALTLCTSVKTVVVAKRTNDAVNMLAGRDFWWHDEIKNATPVK